ncbi:MAG TPA: malonyl-ACP O-methyltransferase BioC [Steroidobacteraceae bacterium]|nr:malonyl-ACP O-methyltransferase BioC [Steroidobacteraceae bacterium]
MAARGSAEGARLDREQLRRAFDRASRAYDAAAVLQARVRSELLERLDLLKLQPDVVLDLGAGTGWASRELKRRHRGAVVIALDIAPGMLREARRHSRALRRFRRVCGDGLRLPLKAASVDLVFSNLMLQWCDDLDAVLAEIRRVLRPGGFLTFSTLGPDTLRELRLAWSRADAAAHVHAFLDMHDVGDALIRAGLVEPVLDVERIALSYENVLALMRDLKAIGAHNVTLTRARGLTGRGKWRTMTEAYETFRHDGRLPASYEVVYGAAWAARGAAVPTSVAAAEGEVRIAPETIRRPPRA